MNGQLIGAPTIAGTVPPNFRGSFLESALSDAEFLRLPKPGERCRLSGLSRTGLIELGDRGAINLKRVRKPGALRGVVLIEKRSLLEYLHSLTADGESAVAR
jgi:hypothetical protein